MLNKDICKRCCQSHRKGVHSDNGWWDDGDDQNWNRGFVLCPSIFHFMSFKIKLPLRKDCGYYMEQLVLSQE